MARSAEFFWVFFVSLGAKNNVFSLAQVGQTKHKTRPPRNFRQHTQETRPGLIWGGLEEKEETERSGLKKGKHGEGANFCGKRFWLRSCFRSVCIMLRKSTIFFLAGVIFLCPGHRSCPLHGVSHALPCLGRSRGDGAGTGAAQPGRAHRPVQATPCDVGGDPAVRIRRHCRFPRACLSLRFEITSGWSS